MNKEEVLKLATLARIDIAESEAEALSHEFEAILKYVSDVKQVEKNESPNGPENFPLRNVLREDANPHEPGVYTKAILEQAPSSEKGFIKVKKIL